MVRHRLVHARIEYRQSIKFYNITTLRYRFSVSLFRYFLQYSRRIPFISSQIYLYCISFFKTTLICPERKMAYATIYSSRIGVYDVCQSQRTVQTSMHGMTHHFHGYAREEFLGIPTPKPIPTLGGSSPSLRPAFEPDSEGLGADY